MHDRPLRHSFHVFDVMSSVRDRRIYNQHGKTDRIEETRFGRIA